MTIKFLQGRKHKFAIIAQGTEGPTIAMHHGGPAYFWKESEISDLHQHLSKLNTNARLYAIMSRGCGVGNARTESLNLADDSALKRAEDMKELPKTDIVVAHSLGAIPVLTAVMEGYISPKALVLLSPNSASLGEQQYWVKEKAKKFPASYALFKHFITSHWVTYASNSLPADFEENIFQHWGALYSRLPNSAVKIQAVLSLLCFHMGDSLKPMKEIQGEPYTLAHHLLTHPENIDAHLKKMFINVGEVMSNWMKNNFVFDYPFLEKLQSYDFKMPIYILSGEDDHISPVKQVQELAKILDTKNCKIVEGAGHLVDTSIGSGNLAKHTAELLAEVVKEVELLSA